MPRRNTGKLLVLGLTTTDTASWRRAAYKPLMHTPIKDNMHQKETNDTRITRNREDQKSAKPPSCDTGKILTLGLTKTDTASWQRAATNQDELERAFPLLSDAKSDRRQCAS